MRFFFAAAVAMLGAGINASALGSDTGNDLLEYCTRTDDLSVGFCLGLMEGFRKGSSLGYVSGMVSGVRGAITVANPKAAEDKNLMDKYINGTYQQLQDVGIADVACVPPLATNQQLKDVLVKWLQSNPERRSQDASNIMYMAFRESFGYPCKTGQNR